MAYISQWITQIVLIILLAVILELLLPNENFQKYVKMVVGLVLIITLLNPVMDLLNVNVDQIIKGLTQSNSDPEIKNSIKVKEKEITEAQKAYVHIYTVDHMKSYVKEALVDQFGLAIKELDFKKGKNDQNKDFIEHVSVLVGEADEQKKKAEQADQQVTVPVKEVKIQITDKKAEDQTEKNDQEKKGNTKVREFLAKKWEIDESKVSVEMEGGDR